MRCNGEKNTAKYHRRDTFSRIVYVACGHVVFFPQLHVVSVAVSGSVQRIGFLRTVVDEQGQFVGGSGHAG